MTDENQTTEAQGSQEVEDVVQATVDDLFSDESQEKTSESQGESAQATDTGEDDKTDEAAAKATESEDESKDAESPAAESGFKAAYLAERAKRQEAENARDKALAAQEEVPDPVEDPEGHARYVARQNIDGKIHGSRQAMMTLREDYSEMEEVFLKLVTDDNGQVIDQGLVSRMNAADAPAVFLYEYTKNHLEAEELRDPEARAKLIAEEANKIVQQEVAKAVADALKAAGKPESSALKATDVPNLTQATAQGSNSEAPIKPPTIDDLMTDSEI